MEIASGPAIDVWNKKISIMTSLAALIVLGWLAASAANAQSTRDADAGEIFGPMPALDEVKVSPDLAMLSDSGSGHDENTDGGAFSNSRLITTHWMTSDKALFAARAADQEIAALYRFSSRGAAAGTGYLGTTKQAALGVPISMMRHFAGFDSSTPNFPSHWLDSSHGGVDALAMGYAWRGVKVEGAAYSGNAQDDGKPVRSESFKLGSRSARLSFKPVQNWVLQFSRGNLSGLDQLVPGGDVRRTTVSATYQQAYGDGDWQTTLAWGRNARKNREPTVGYLVESTVRFSGTHVMFGRVEQTGSDELMRQNESLQRQLFKMNKVTVGYFHDLRLSSTLNVDLGAFVSRHFVPSQMTPSYGNDPTAYMVFMRVRLQ